MITQTTVTGVFVLKDCNSIQLGFDDVCSDLR